jgi:hypothetical protein
MGAIGVDLEEFASASRSCCARDVVHDVCSLDSRHEGSFVVQVALRQVRWVSWEELSQLCRCPDETGDVVPSVEERRY